MIQDALLGLSTGDALGVPVEFESRETLCAQPVTDMAGYGTYNLPPGTWSDDSSLAFCLAEALAGDFSTRAAAENFRKWLYENYWTPRGEVFDVGIATDHAIHRFSKGAAPEEAGGAEETDNGNGSLMRILPLLFYIKDKPVEERFRLTEAVSSITHRHIRSVIGCFYYLEFARGLLEGKDKFAVYEDLQQRLPEVLRAREVPAAEVALFHRLLEENIRLFPESEIQSSGYVLHTLEASIWCLLTTDTYADAVLKAVNLGCDTDTTGAVTGGLAGLLYGQSGIPENWVAQLARLADIEDLAKRMEARLGG